MEPLLCRKRILVSGLPYEVIKDSDGRWEGGGLPERRGQQSLAGKLPTPGVSLSSRFACKIVK